MAWWVSTTVTAATTSGAVWSGKGIGVGWYNAGLEEAHGRSKMAEGGATGVGELEGVLENLRALSEEVTTAAVLSRGGELRGSTLSSGVDRERHAAMLAALAGIVRRTSRENGGSGFTQARIGAEGGYVLLVGLEGGGAIAATTGPDARVGLVLYDMRNVRAEIERMLGLGDGDHGDDASEVGGPGERKQ